MCETGCSLVCCSLVLITLTFAALNFFESDAPLETPFLDSLDIVGDVDFGELGAVLEGLAAELGEGRGCGDIDGHEGGITGEGFGAIVRATSERGNVQVGHDGGEVCGEFQGRGVRRVSGERCAESFRGEVCVQCVTHPEVNEREKGGNSSGGEQRGPGLRGCDEIM